MTLTYKDGIYALASNYAERMIPKEAGFRWNPAAKQWETNNDDVARKLRQHADNTCREKLDELTRQHEAAKEASRATDAAIDVPSPEGLAYLPFQKAGIAFAMNRPSTLIGDEMGLGKTIQAVGVINADASIKRVLVVCPASLRLNWKREVKRWLTRPLRVEIANGVFPDQRVADVTIINYDILRKHRAALRAETFDLMIADECHYLKNDKAQRTQETLGKYDKDASKAVVPITSKRKLFLTGTPILNRPIELWPLLKSLGVFTNWMRYVERYCAGHQTQWGWDVSGSSHLDELQDTLRSTIMVRRLKKDVLTELPPKRRMVVEVPANGAGQAVEAEAAAYARHEQELDELRVRVEIAKASEGEDEYKSAVDRLREAAQVAFTEMSVLRHQTALAKVPAVIEHAVEALEGGTQKLVIFAHHHDVIAAIMAGISAYNPVRLTGEMGADNRQASVDKFQADESCRVFIGSIQAAGLGLTLTASAHVLFAELDWVPGNITQAEDRCHRIGQTDSVLVQHLVLEDSLDARMAKTLVAKQQVIDAALDKIEAQTPLVPEAANGDAPATTHSTRREIEKLAEQMTPEMISSVHAKLRFLAGICDGAQQLDGMGFNKFDARLGHSLANMGQLTARQAALGSKLVRKYRRQLGE